MFLRRGEVGPLRMLVCVGGALHPREPGLAATVSVSDSDHLSDNYRIYLIFIWK